MEPVFGMEFDFELKREFEMAFVGQIEIVHETRMSQVVER